MITIFYWLFLSLLVVLFLFCISSSSLIVWLSRQPWFQQLRVCGLVLVIVMASNIGVVLNRYYSNYTVLDTMTADRNYILTRMLEAERDCILSLAICLVLLAINRQYNSTRAYLKLTNNFTAMEAQARSATLAGINKDKIN